MIKDDLVSADWPKFLHPFPLSDKWFLVACWPDQKSGWGIYLADVFDNLVLLREEPGYALLEPIPVLARPVPPVIPDRAASDSSEATVYLHDVYAGHGLAGVPRGTVKNLRVLCLPLRLSASRRTSPDWARRSVGSDADLGHGARRSGRFRHVPDSGEHALGPAAPGRPRPGGAADAQLVHRDAR